MAIWLLLLQSCTGVVQVEDRVHRPVRHETAALETITDVFTYRAPVVDVLFVIDASCSMAPRTASLVGSLDGLVDGWLASGFDFHVGAVNIDEYSAHGELVQVEGRRWSDPAVSDPGALLRRLVDAVTDPSAIESGRSAAYKALEWSDEPGEPNEGFLRTDSEIAVIVHTDERDQSGTEPVTQQEFIDYMLGLREPGRVAFHAIASSLDYSQVSEGVGGVVWSVDNTPYGPALQAMSDMIDPTLLVLSAPAVESSLEVRMIQPDLTAIQVDASGYVFDPSENTVEMLLIPADGATLEITYDSAG